MTWVCECVSVWVCVWVCECVSVCVSVWVCVVKSKCVCECECDLLCESCECLFSFFSVSCHTYGDILQFSIRVRSARQHMVALELSSLSIIILVFLLHKRLCRVIPSLKLDQLDWSNACTLTLLCSLPNGRWLVGLVSSSTWLQVPNSTVLTLHL